MSGENAQVTHNLVEHHRPFQTIRYQVALCLFVFAGSQYKVYAL